MQRTLGCEMTQSDETETLGANSVVRWGPRGPPAPRSGGALRRTMLRDELVDSAHWELWIERDIELDVVEDLEEEET